MVVARAVKACGNSLRDINLKMCCIKRRGAVAVARALCDTAGHGDAQNEIRLDVNGNEISEAGMAELREIFNAHSGTTLGSFSDNEEDCDDEEDFHDADIANDMKQEDGGSAGEADPASLDANVAALSGAVESMGI